MQLVAPAKPLPTVTGLRCTSREINATLSYAPVRPPQTNSIYSGLTLLCLIGTGFQRQSRAQEWQTALSIGPAPAR
jgi:hypothetical protein